MFLHTNILFGNNSISIKESVRGEVLGYNKQTETHIWTSRDTGAHHSSNTQRIDFFIKSNDGRETQVNFVNHKQLALRDGHEISLIEGSFNGRTYDIAVVNHTTQTITLFDSIDQLYSRKFRLKVMATIVVPILFFKFYIEWGWGLSVLWGTVVGVPLASWFATSRQLKHRFAFDESLRTELSKLLN